MTATRSKVPKLLRTGYVLLVLAFLGLVFLVYAYLTLTPTGGGEREKATTEAAQYLTARISQSGVQTTQTAVNPVSQMANVALTSDSTGSSTTKGANFFQQLIDSEQAAYLLMARLPTPVESSLCGGQVSHDLTVPVSDLSGPIGQLSHLPAATEEAVFDAIRPRLCVVIRLNPDDPVTSERLATDLVSPLEKYLDGLERTLMSPSWSLPPVGSRSMMALHFSQFGWLAVLRACERGEVSRANLLLERTVQALSLEAPYQFPCAPGDLPGQLLCLAQRDEISSQTRVDVDRMLERMTPTPEEQRRLQAIYRAYLHEYWRGSIPSSTGDSRWYRFLNGSPARMVSKIARPVFLRELDGWETASSLGDTRGMEVSRMVMRWSLMGMGARTDGDFARMDKAYEYIPRSTEFPARVGECSRLMLAVGKWHRETGKWPASVRDLVPRYLDSSFLPTSSTAWACSILPPFRRIIVRSADEASVVQAAVGEFENKHHRYPSPEELRPLRVFKPVYSPWAAPAEGMMGMMRPVGYKPETREVELQSEDTEPMPVFCKVSLQPSSADRPATAALVSVWAVDQGRDFRQMLGLLAAKKKSDRDAEK